MGGAGTISFEKNFAKFTVRKLSDLIENVMPHFETYPLLTKKYADFELFRQILFIQLRSPQLLVAGGLKEDWRANLFSSPCFFF